MKKHLSIIAALICLTISATAKATPQTSELKAAIEFPGEKTNFRGYVRYDKIKTASGHFSIICPKNAAPAKPLLWRSLCWEAIKPFSNADLKLVEQVYHIVLAHENDVILEERFKKLGESIQVIIENKGHTHGMKGSTPVLEFIKNYTK